MLKHPDIEQVTQIDIDEQVTRMAEKYFPELCQSNNDPRATLAFADGIKFMREAAPESIDVIIVDSTDPIGPGEGLFMRFMIAVVKPCAQVVFWCSKVNHRLFICRYLKIIRNAMQDAGFAALQVLVFPQMVYPSGWWTCAQRVKMANLLGFAKRMLPTRHLALILQREYTQGRVSLA